MSEVDQSVYGLAENEKMIKSWTYAKTKGSVGSVHELLVTDKRVIALSNYHYSNGNKIVRNEIRRDNVSNISVSAGIQNFKVIAIILLIIALGCIGIGAAAPMVVFIVIGAVLAIIGLVLLFKKNTALTLVVCGNSCGYGLSVYASMGLQLTEKKNKKLKVKVDADTAKEIVTQIGALLLAND